MVDSINNTDDIKTSRMDICFFDIKEEPCIEMTTPVVVIREKKIRDYRDTRDYMVTYLMKFFRKNKQCDCDSMLFRTIRFLDIMLFETDIDIPKDNISIYGFACACVVFKLHDDPIDLRCFSMYYPEESRSLAYKELILADIQVTRCLQYRMLTIVVPYEVMGDIELNDLTCYIFDMLYHDPTIWSRYTSESIIDAVREISQNFNKISVVITQVSADILRILQSGCKYDFIMKKYGLYKYEEEMKLLHIRSDVPTTATRPSIPTIYPTTNLRFVNRSDFRNRKMIGRGTYGRVYLVDYVNGQEFVIKDEENCDPHFGVPKSVMYEATTLATLGIHPNIVTSYGIVIDQDTKISSIVLESMDYDLCKFYKMNKNTMNCGHIRKILHQILTGVAYIHQNGITHRDLKPQNILCRKKDFSFKIADFGMAGVSSIMNDLNIQTLWYRAPEVLLGDHRYDTSIDIWSVGCILGELAGKEPWMFPDFELKDESKFDSKNESEITIGEKQLCKIFKTLGRPDLDFMYQDLTNWDWAKTKFPDVSTKQARFDILGDQGNDLLNKMLNINPLRRITASEALQHPFFTS